MQMLGLLSTFTTVQAKAKLWLIDDLLFSKLMYLSLNKEFMYFVFKTNYLSLFLHCKTSSGFSIQMVTVFQIDESKQEKHL